MYEMFATTTDDHMTASDELCANCLLVNCRCGQQIYPNDDVMLANSTNYFDPPVTSELSVTNSAASCTTKSKNEFGSSRCFVVCRICSATYSRHKYYEKHWRQCHDNVNRIHMFENGVKCSECSRYFPSQASVRTHKNSAHKSKITFVQEEQGNNAAKSTETHTDQRYCPLCNFISNGYNELLHHLDDAHGGLRVQPGNQQPSKKGRTTDTVEQNSQLVCYKCGLVCIDKSELSIHFAAFCSDRTESPEMLFLNPGLKPMFPVEKESRNIVAPVDNDQNLLFRNGLSLVQRFDMYPMELMTNFDTTDVNCGVGARADEILEQGISSSEAAKSFIGNGHNGLMNNDMESEVVNVGVTRSTKHFSGSDGRARCSICRFIAYNKESLIEHLKTSHGYKTCPVCDYYGKVSDLLSHLKSAHAYEAKVNLNDNNCKEKDMNGTVANSNQQTVNGGDKLNETNTRKRKKRNPVACRLCGVTYVSSCDYRNHFMKCHPEHSVDEMFDNGWKCNQCLLMFKSVKSLQCHWTKQHRESYNSGEFSDFVKQLTDETQNHVDCCLPVMTGDQIPFDGAQEEQTGVDDQLVCTDCGVQCVDREQLILHKALVHYSCTEAVGLLDSE